jgi:MFS family permease
MILVRTRPPVYLSTIMGIWGMLTMVMAAIHDFKHLVVLRVLIGVVEAAFAPGILMIISSWYKREEQSKRFGIYICAAILSGAFGGIIAGAITGGLEGAHGLRGWRWLFIVEGAATVGWAFCAGFLLLDFPAQCRYMNEREKYIAITRLQEGGVTTRTEDTPKMSKKQVFKTVLTDWRLIGFVIGYMVCISTIALETLMLTNFRSLSDPQHSPTSTLLSSRALDIQAPCRLST